MPRVQRGPSVSLLQRVSGPARTSAPPPRRAGARPPLLRPTRRTAGQLHGRGSNAHDRADVSSPLSGSMAPARMGNSSVAASITTRTAANGTSRRAASAASAQLSMSTSNAPLPAAAVFSAVVASTQGLDAIGPGCASNSPDGTTAGMLSVGRQERSRQMTSVATTTSPVRSQGKSPPPQPSETNRPARGTARAAPAARTRPIPVCVSKHDRPSASRPAHRRGSSAGRTSRRAPSTARVSQPSAVNAATSTAGALLVTRPGSAPAAVAGARDVRHAAHPSAGRPRARAAPRSPRAAGR